MTKRNANNNSSPQKAAKSRVDLESEIAALRLELNKSKEIENQVKELKGSLFNAERNNETLLNQ